MSVEDYNGSPDKSCSWDEIGWQVYVRFEIVMIRFLDDCQLQIRIATATIDLLKKKKGLIVLKMKCDDCICLTK